MVRPEAPRSAGRVPELGAGHTGGSVFVCFTLFCVTHCICRSERFLSKTLIKAQHGGNGETLEAYGSDWQGEGPVLLFCRRTDL